MADFIQKLFFGAGLDVRGLYNDAGQIEVRLAGMGKFAGDTFQKQIARELARAVSPTAFQKEANQSRIAIKNFGDDAKKIFEQTLGTTQAKRIFDPIRRESSTFFQELKSGLSGSLGIGKIAGGVGIGVLAADAVKGLIAAGAEAIKFSAAFETSLAKVRTIADEGLNIDKIRDDIKSLSTDIPKDIVGLSEGLFSIIGSGVRKTSDALDVLDKSARAATAGFTETKLAADAGVTALNAFGKTADSIEEIFNTLFKTVDLGKIEFSDLAVNLGEVANPAAIAGVSLNELGQILSTVTLAGTPASEAFTGVKNLLNNIIAPAEGASNAAKRFGFEFSKAGIEATGGIEKLILKIREATAGDAQKLRELFPEARALRVAQILTETLADTYVDLGVEFKKVTGTSGEMRRAFDIASQTAENQAQILKNNLANAVESAGRSLLNVLLPALRAINESFDDTDPLDKLIKKFQNLGTEQAQAAAKALIASRDAEKAKQAFDELAQIRTEEAKTAANLEAILDRRFKQSNEAREEEATNLLKLAEIEDGRDEIQRRIQRSIEREEQIIKNVANAKQQGLVLSQNELVALNARVDKERLLRDALEKILKLRHDISKAETPKPVFGTVQTLAAAPQAPISSETTERLKELVKLGGELADTAREELKSREEISAVIEKTRKQLELVFAATPFERSLVEIRQRFDGLREQAHGNLKAISQIAILERRAIEDAINAVSKIKLPIGDIREKQGDFVKQLQKQLSVTLPLNLKLEAAKIDTRPLSIKIGEKIKNALSDIAFPFESFIIDLKNIGIDIDELARAIGGDFGNLLSSISSFSVSFTSGNIIGGITSAISAIDSLFNIIIPSGNKARENELRRLEEEARQAEERNRTSLQSAQDATQRRLTSVSERLSQAFDRLAASIGANDLSVQELLDTLEKSKIGIAGFNLSASNEQLVNFFRSVQNVTGKLPKTLQDILDSFSPLTKFSPEITEFLKIIKTLPPTIQEQLIALINSLLLAGDGLKEFGKTAQKAFDNLIDSLNLKFDLLNIDDPIKKLEELRKGILAKFKSIIPVTDAGIRKLIEDGLTALEAGGETLVNFLKSFDLEELTADQFRDLLQLLNQLANDAKSKVEDIAGAGEELVLSQVKSITFQQGNRLLDETATIRIVVTQILDAVKNFSGLGNFSRAAINALDTNSSLPQLEFQKIDEVTTMLSVDKKMLEIQTKILDKITTGEVKNNIQAQAAIRQIEEIGKLQTPQVISLDSDSLLAGLHDELMAAGSTELQMLGLQTQMLDLMRQGPGLNIGNLAAALTGLNTGLKRIAGSFVIPDIANFPTVPNTEKIPAILEIKKFPELIESSLSVERNTAKLLTVQNDMLTAMKGINMAVGNNTIIAIHAAIIQMLNLAQRQRNFNANEVIPSPNINVTSPELEISEEIITVFERAFRKIELTGPTVTKQETPKNFINIEARSLNAITNSINELIKQLSLGFSALNINAPALNLAELQNGTVDFDNIISEISGIRTIQVQMLDFMRQNNSGFNRTDFLAALTGLNAGVTRNNFFIIKGGTITEMSRESLSQIDRALVDQALAASRARGVN